MQLIVVTGAPATGKTYIATEVARKLRLPLIARDTIKEALFDALGYTDREWSSKLGGASYDVMFALVRSAFFAGVERVVIESNFTPRAAATIQQIADEHQADIIQVFCRAMPECVWERFRARAVSGERHPGHADSDNLEEFRMKFFSDSQVPLALSGQLITVDTTDFLAVDVEQIITALNENLVR